MAGLALWLKRGSQLLSSVDPATQTSKVVFFVVQATWEAEELRSSNLDLQAQVSKAEGKNEELQESSSQLNQQLQTAKQQILRLEGFAEQCAAIPGLKKELAAAQQRGDMLQAERAMLQVRSSVCGLQKLALQHVKNIILMPAQPDCHHGCLQASLDSEKQHLRDSQRTLAQTVTRMEDLQEEVRSSKAAADSTAHRLQSEAATLQVT